MKSVEHEHKKQLHERISERRAQLGLTLSRLRTDPHDGGSIRARSIEEALAAVETHFSGGWDAIGELESVSLTRWLDTSRFLFDGTASPPLESAVQS